MVKKQEVIMLTKLLMYSLKVVNLQRALSFKTLVTTLTCIHMRVGSVPKVLHNIVIMLYNSVCTEGQNYRQLDDSY